jgi:hypothetical protein
MALIKPILLTILVCCCLGSCMAGVKCFFLHTILDDNNLSRAKMDVRNLEMCVTIFKTLHGDWPESLEELTERDKEGNPAMVKDKNALFDPWKQPYLYDRNNLNPDSGVPLIWSDGPPGAHRPIKNWPPETMSQWPDTPCLIAYVGCPTCGVLLAWWWICQSRASKRSRS